MQGDGANATKDAAAPGDASAVGVIACAPRSAVRPSDPELAALWAAHPEQYHLLGELARGGMGRVLEARDIRHGRRIAIKMLLEASPEAARRFAREARVTARLQHPGIVTLYEAGRWSSGEPYLALELVVGRPLHEVIDQTPTLEERLQLLPHLIAVAEAIAYAHGEGVVHRDLKPANVLIGAFGETVVIDWGLAREIDSPAEREGDDPDESALRERPSVRELTVVGRTIGTPSYMPPEQARGERVDAAADIYSLGALMHHVFCGAAPYAGAPRGLTLAQVLRGPPRSLSELVPDLPRDLGAIVEKAMSRDAAGRYASAADLSRDLKRYAAGQRVAAHSYSSAALLRRWAARHRTALVVAAMFLLALAVVGASSVWRIAKERDRAEAARVAAEHQRAEATLQRDAAARLVEFMLVDLRSRLEPIGRLDVLSTVAGEVESYYASVSSGPPDSLTLRRRGTALASMGRVDEVRGDGRSARTKYESALDLGARALSLDPANSDAASLIANAHALLASLDVEEGKLDDAWREREAARAAVRGLEHAHPDEVKWRMLSAQTEIATGWIDVQRGDLAAADAVWLFAVEELRRVLALDPSHRAAKSALVSAWSSSSDIARQLGHFDEARDRLLRALAANDDATLGPLDYDARFWRGELTLELGWIALEQGRPSDALVKLNEAREILQELTAHDPSNLEWLKWRSLADSDLCRALSMLGDLAVARERCFAAVVTAERLVALQNGKAQARLHLGIEYRRLGGVDLARGHSREAVEAFEKSRQLFLALTAEAPKNAQAALFLAKAQRSLGVALLGMRRYDAAAEIAAAGLATVKAAFSAAPADTNARLLLAALEELEGAIAAARGDKASARRSLLAARETLGAPGERGRDSEDDRVIGERIASCLRALDGGPGCDVPRVIP